MKVFILIVSIAVYSVAYMYVSEKAYEAKRRKFKRRRNRLLSFVPIDAKESLEDNLCKDDCTKDYNIAVLYVNGQIKDTKIIGDYASEHSISEFSNKGYTDKLLYYPGIMNTIIKKIGGVKTDIASGTYYEDVVNSIIGGRHGYEKEDVKNAFVVHIKTSLKQMLLISNLGELGTC